MEADALEGYFPSPGLITISLPAGTYLLTIAGLDIGCPSIDCVGSIEIHGAGMNTTLVDGNQRFRVFNVAPGGVLTLQDLTVQNGFVEDVCGQTCLDAGEYGGGLRNASGGSLSLIRVKVTGNRTLLNNQRGGAYGGGIHNEGSLYLEDCQITSNSATGSQWGAWGGGLSNFYGAKATIVRTIFQANKTAVPKSGEGGAIANWTGARLYVTASRFLDNEAGEPGQLNSDGGALFNYGTALLKRCTLARNRNYGGGAGGGIFNRGVLSVVNSTVSGNTSTCDGGGVATDPAFEIRNSTFSGNHSSCSGGGIKGPVEVWNSILAGNTDASGANECQSMTSHGYNLVQGACAFTKQPGDITGVDPMLGPLQDNGGPAETQRLLPGSPAIDSANPVAPGSTPDACEKIDERGVTRPQGTYCDIGAFEKLQRPPAN